MLYHIEYTSKFKKQHKLLKKQRKTLNKLYTVIEKLANGEQLDEKYLNHKLFRDKYYVDCYEYNFQLQNKPNNKQALKPILLELNDFQLNQK